jgi:oxygen-independent coproporphyrinogen-3 oxidase
VTSRAPHLYVHVPFCARKCPYCDFNSHAGRDAEMERYFEALLREARQAARDLRPRTIFVGGGTPTHPPAPLLERYLVGLAETVGLSDVEEFTVEANPGTLTPDKVAALRRAGVDRVSLGVQSFDPRHLATLHRIHDGDDAVRGVEALRAGGIPRLSMDLILAIRGQTLDEQRADLERAVALGTGHLSAYVLTIEEGTAFERRVEEGRMDPTDDDHDLPYQHLAASLLADAGFSRYEISNYARPGEECRHNLGYWRNADWIGIGAGAHSHVRGTRWKNEDDPGRYALRVLAGGGAEVWRETTDASTALFDTMLMGLRLAEGVDLVAAAERTGIDARTAFADAISRHVAEGLVVLHGTRLRLTARGLDLASYVTRSFLPEPQRSVR